MSKEQFLKVPYSILSNQQLNDGDKLTLSLIYSLYGAKKNVYISNNTLGDKLGISRTAASERITKLEQLGYIKCDRISVNNKQRRTIIPLRMVAEPTRVVGKPNRVVGKPNSISRETDQGLVGEVGSIRLPLLLDNTLDNILHKNIKSELELIEEQIEQITIEINNQMLEPEYRNKLVEDRFNLYEQKKILVRK